MIGEVVSADFEVLAVCPVQEKTTMEEDVDDYDKGQGMPGGTATGQEVLCSTHLGMTKWMQLESGKDTLMVIKAKVVRDVLNKVVDKYAYAKTNIVLRSADFKVMVSREALDHIRHLYIDNNHPVFDLVPHTRLDSFIISCYIKLGRPVVERAFIWSITALSWNSNHTFQPTSFKFGLCMDAQAFEIKIILRLV